MLTTKREDTSPLWEQLTVRPRRRKARPEAVPTPTPGELLAALGREVLGESPGFLHPVNWMGRVIWLLERLAPRSGRVRQYVYGAMVTGFVPSLFALLAWMAQRRAYSKGPAAGVATSASLLKATFSVRGLAQAANEVRDALQEEDIDSARKALRALVSRPVDELTSGLAASATVESVAENTTDSFIAPWFYYALGGLPAAVFYRGVNTLDSRIGYRTERHRYVGWPAAKLDDLLNFVPARLSAILIVGSAAVWRRDARRALRTMRRERGKTASPNAGWTMAAMAGALGRRLEKPGEYRIGARWWRRPDAKDIAASVRIMYTVAVAAAALLYAVALLRQRLTTTEEP